MAAGWAFRPLSHRMGVIDPTYEMKLARARELIVRRDEIDAELAELFGGETKRGRPRKPRDAEAPTEPADA
jgi:hypothetical protein